MKRVFVTTLPPLGEWRYVGPFDHYIRHVLRSQPSDLFAFFNDSGIATGQLIGLHKQHLMFHIEQHHPTQTLHTGITIAMGIIKPQNMEWVIQKATELGADCLIPLITERTQGHYYNTSKQEHWHKTMIQGCMQSGRNHAMTIESPHHLSQWLPQESRTVVYFDPRGTQSLSLAHQPVVLLIGPEGGFSTSEHEFIMSTQPVTVRLGQHILKSETAAVAGVVQQLTLQGLS